jgi:hypothetical protein
VARIGPSADITTLPLAHQGKKMNQMTTALLGPVEEAPKHSLPWQAMLAFLQ